MAAELDERQRLALRAGPQLVHGQRRRPDRCRTSCTSTARTTARSCTRDNRANLYGELPTYEQHAQRRLRQADLHADELGAAQRQLPRLAARSTRATCSPSNASATTGTGNEARQKIGTADGSWVINSRSLPDVQVHALRQRDAGPPGQHRQRVGLDGAGHAARHQQPRSRMGLLTVPVPSPARPAYNAFVQPLIDRYGYVQNGVQRRRRHRRLRAAVRRRRLLPRRRPVRLQPRPSAERCQHDLHFGYQRYVDSEDLMRSSNGWGVDHRARRPSRASTARRSSTPPRFQQQATRRWSPTIHSEYQSQSFEVNDTIRWSDWTFNAGVLASNDTLYGQGLREDASKPLSGYVAAPGNKYKMYEIPFSKMIQPRLGATWAYNGKRHGLRELRALQPGGELAAARRVVGPQPGDDHQRALRRQRRAVRGRRRSAPRRASCSSTT